MIVRCATLQRVPARLLGAACLLLLLLFGTAGSAVVRGVQSRTAAAAQPRLSAGPFAGRALYASPHSAAARAAAAGHSPVLRRLAQVPQAIWLSGGSPDAVERTVEVAAHEAEQASSVPVFVLYDIPHRDCGGGQSSGGAQSAADYRRFVSAFARANAGRPAIVVLEPDSLAQLDCLDPSQQTGRLALLRWAAGMLSGGHLAVYLDGGVHGWKSARTMARRLDAAGVAHARGFAVNVANYDGTTAETEYGLAIAAHIGWKHFVIDTSRNGRPGASGHWCNVPGMAVGALPGTPASSRAVDALLWIKPPGESDGSCGVGPRPAGRFDPGVATDLMRRGGH
jgi:endoglucanase